MQDNQPNFDGVPIIGAKRAPAGQTAVWWGEQEPTFIKTELVPVKIELQCPKCKEGTMDFNGAGWPGEPPAFHHTCTKCGYTAALPGAQFPTIGHQPKHSEAITVTLDGQAKDVDAQFRSTH